MATKKRLIDANALFEEIEKVYLDHYERSSYKFIHDFFNAMRRRIRGAKTVDAVEVVHGRWEKHKCTSCGEPEPGYYDHIEDCIVYTPTAFCPNCGAKMDGDGDA